MNKSLILLIIIGILLSLGAPPLSAKITYDQTDKTDKKEWMEHCMGVVQTVLGDESAQFEKVFFALSADNVPVTCGQMKAQKQSGAEKITRFFSAGTAELTHIEGKEAGFEALWDIYCK